MEFIEAPAFTPHVSEYLSDDDCRNLQNHLAAKPDLGAVIPGTGGFRKLRWPDPNRGKGRRGGLRIIYYYFLTDQQIWLMTLYSKGEATDLSPAEKRTLALETELSPRGTRFRGKQKSRRTRE
jgi:hypothetical protein